MNVDFLFGTFPDLWLANLSALLFYGLCLASVFAPVRNYLRPRLQTPTPSTGLYLEPLDSLRGLAALWIAAAHTMFRTYPFFSLSMPYAVYLGVGSKAVAVFCVLSGLLIWRSVKKLKSLDDLRMYLKRRLLRIYPLYFFTLAVVVALQIVPSEPGRLIAEFTMMRSFLPSKTIVLPHVWSLYVEVIYYALAPLMVLMFGRRALPIAALLTVAFFIAAPFGARETPLLPYFFVGITLAELFDQYGKKIPQWAGALAFVLGAWLLSIDITNDWVATLLGTPKDLVGFSVGLAIACFLLVIGITVSKPFAWVFSLPPLRILGTVSYSVFMLHPIFLYFCFPLQGLGENAAGRALLRETLPMVAPWYLPLVFLPGIIFWAILSYLFIERPFLNMRKRPAPAGPMVAAQP